MSAMGIILKLLSSLVRKQSFFYINYLIRRKEKEDCASVANIVTVTWNETYQGIVNDDFFNDLYENEEQRANNSYNNFSEKDNHQLVLEVDN